MKQETTNFEQQEDIKRLSIVVIFLSLFVTVLFGLL